MARLLAFALLAFIAYTTTAESVHRHGGFTLGNASSATAIDSSSDADSSAKDSRSISECLICQLRQQLSFSLLSALPQLIAPQTQAAPSVAAASLNTSGFEAPRRGRAPPTFSLS